MIGIYKITSPSGRVYIGQSINIKNRFAYYKLGYYKSQPKLCRSFEKYGIIKHTFEILIECEEEKLNELERYYQEVFNVITNGLNCILTKTTTRSGRVCEETRKKISEGGRGRVWSDETRKKQMKRLKSNHPMLGKKLTAEHIEKIRQANIGRKCSEDFKRAQSLRMSERVISESTRKKFRERELKIVLNTQTGIFYYGVEEAAEYYPKYTVGSLYKKLNPKNKKKKNNTSLIYC